MKKYLLLIYLLSNCVVLYAQTSNIRSNVRFEIRNAGFKVEGTLNGWEGVITFYPDNLERSKVSASVQVETIDTGIEARDKHLRGEDYFEIENYPKIYLVSKSFSRIDPNNFTGIFDLTIKAVTKEITIPLIFSKEGSKTILEGDFELDRLDYGVGGKSFILSKKVKVILEAVF